MADIKVCDRCKARYEPLKPDIFTEAVWSVCETFGCETPRSVRQKLAPLGDFCPDCVASFKDWLSQKNELVVPAEGDGV